LFRKQAIFLLVLVLALGALGALAGCGGDDDETTTTAAPAATETTEGAETGDTQGGVTSTEKFELKVAHIWPAPHAIEAKFLSAFAEDISAATNGNVTLQTYPGQTLLKGPEVYEGVINGVADIGISVYAYNAGRFPIVEAFLLPGISYESSKAAAAAITEGLQTLEAAEIEDTHVLMSFATGPGHLLMKGKTIKSMADMNGLEIGATAGPRGDGIKLLGATPVVLPMPEVYEAQSRGVISGVIAPYEAMTGFKLADVTDSITETPFLYVNFFYITMNKDKWESMPADYQQAITEVSQKYYEDMMMGLFDQLNQEALDAAQAAKDIEVVELSEEEKAKWIETLQPVFDQYKETLNSKGLDGEKILATVQELTDKYNAEFPE
jgi:TRAP-type C4-dicarboxylate transport system substrate-binding protein